MIKLTNNCIDLRDYFAAKAIQNFSWTGENDDECAISCYEIADAMIRAKNEKTEDESITFITQRVERSL